jgi:hypothetical protein
MTDSERLMSTKKESRATREPRDLAELKPFHGAIIDLAMVDSTQLELFAAVGRTKGPFPGIIDWPYLNSLIQDRSRTLLERDGEAAWKAGGGIYGDDGKPTFSLQSSCAALIVQGIADDPAGFIWTDAQGTGWAVRLVSMDTRDSLAHAGFAISWNGGGRVIDPLVRGEYRRAVEQQLAELDIEGEAETRSKLRQIADRMWLYERGEQLLWAIHAAVLMQRRSIIRLPDVELGEIVWGGCQSAWPSNWRSSLGDILWSLSQLHVAELHVGGTTWRPEFTMRSVAVAAYEDWNGIASAGAFAGQLARFGINRSRMITS